MTDEELVNEESVNRAEWVTALRSGYFRAAQLFLAGSRAYEGVCLMAYMDKDKFDDRDGPEIVLAGPIRMTPQERMQIHEAYSLASPLTEIAAIVERGGHDC